MVAPIQSINSLTIGLTTVRRKVTDKQREITFIADPKADLVDICPLVSEIKHIDCEAYRAVVCSSRELCTGERMRNARNAITTFLSHRSVH
jgi:hypothetical protein